MLTTQTLATMTVGMPSACADEPVAVVVVVGVSRGGGGCIQTHVDR